MKAQCPHCGTQYELEDSMNGTKVECECGHKWIVAERSFSNSQYTFLEQKPQQEKIETPNIETKCPYCNKNMQTQKSAIENKTHVMCIFCHGNFIPKRSYNAVYGCIAILFLGAIAVFFLFMIGSCIYDVNRDYGSGGKYEHNLSASHIAEETIKSKLLNPNGARFQDYSSQEIKRINNNTYEVTMWCDATNAFGGTIRKTFTVKIEISGNTGFGKIISER